MTSQTQTAQRHQAWALATYIVDPRHPDRSGGRYWVCSGCGFRAGAQFTTANRPCRDSVGTD